MGDVLLILNMVIGLIAFVCMLMCIIDGSWVGEYISFVVWVAAIILFFGSIYKLYNAPWQYDSEPYAVEQIVSLNDNTLTTGQIYARRGYVGEDLYYLYMKQVSDGGFVAGKVKASISTVYYTEDNFRVEWYRKTKCWKYLTDEETYVKIYIPEGSISSEYNVDLE